MTFARSRQQENGALILSAAVSRAKTLAWQAKEPGLQEKGPVFGMSSLGSLANFDPATSSWRTSQRCLLGGWIPFSETWPRSGMTQSGTLYQLQPLVPRTGEIASGLWPTPTADKCIGVAPTQEMAERFRRKGSSGSFVEAVAARLWPTPCASRMPCEGTVRLCRQRWINGDATLEEASAIAGRDVRKSQGKVPAMLPTPTCEDAKNNGNASRNNRNMPPLNAVAGGALNPTWVEWLMGFPLGWTDLDA